MQQLLLERVERKQERLVAEIDKALLRSQLKAAIDLKDVRADLNNKLLEERMEKKLIEEQSNKINELEEKIDDLGTGDNVGLIMLLLEVNTFAGDALKLAYSDREIPKQRQNSGNIIQRGLNVTKNLFKTPAEVMNHSDLLLAFTLGQACAKKAEDTIMYAKAQKELPAKLFGARDAIIYAMLSQFFQFPEVR